MLRTLFFAVSVSFFFVPAVQSADSGDADLGKTVFARCTSCHQIGKGATNRVGPELNRLFGRRAGSIEGFPYSKSLTRAGNDGLEWHFDTLDAYLENPKALVSGTRMSFRGVKDQVDRENLLAYLRLFSDSPANIPEAEPTATRTDHGIDPAILALQGDPDYGEYLSGECVTCHQVNGTDEGIPSITRWPEEDFVIALHSYRNGLRPHPVMQMIAGRLSDEEIAALAAYFKDLE